MTEWSRATVESCLKSLALRKMPKVLLRNYKPSGRFPIVDQGQNLIAGWTDDDGGLISTDLPVVVFGDHTRAFKYVDFPFVRGADGTQVLKPKPGIDPLFFYYACKAIDLPGRGYNRHFRVLKEAKIPIPALQEQRSIAHALRRVDDAISLQDEQLGMLTDLKRAAMQTLFTRGLRGEPQKETEVGPMPESWEMVQLGSLGRIGNGSTPRKTTSGYWAGGTYPWLTSAKVYDRNIVEGEQFVTELALTECHLPRIKPGAVLIAITGQGKTLGHCAVLGIEATINQHLAYIEVDTNTVHPSFVRGYLETQYNFFRQVGSGGGSTKGALTCAFLRVFPIPMPSVLEEQREIVSILEVIDLKIDLHWRKRAVLDELFKALLHKLMTGEIQVGELSLAGLKES